jgi:2-oxoglutarate dehydrogenase complex dehydrogenase (E1) component-like enzyme
METGTRFQPILIDPLTDKSTAKHVVLLSGKLYYEVLKERQSRNLNDAIALVRIEELAPFPFKIRCVSIQMRQSMCGCKRNHETKAHTLMLPTAYCQFCGG